MFLFWVAAVNVSTLLEILEAEVEARGGQVLIVRPFQPFLRF